MAAIAKLGLAMIPQLAGSSTSTSTAVAMATAAMIGQGISQGWTRESRVLHAREYRVKPYFALERPSGTKLETTYAPNGSIVGLRYVKTYPVPPDHLGVIYAPKLLMFSLVKSVFFQAMFVVTKNIALMEAAERSALDTGEDFEFVVLPPDEIRPMIKRSSIGFVRDIAVQTVRHVMDIYAGRRLSPQIAWKLRKGFKQSAMRKRYLPWYQRLTRTTRTVFVSTILSSLADWTVNSTVDVYRMCKAAKTSRHHKKNLLWRLLKRMFANAVKAGVCLVGAAAGQSVRHHLLTNYFHAILSVVLAQFKGLGFLDGMQGVIRLAEASPYIQEVLEKEMGMSITSMRSFCQADAAAESKQALPDAWHMPAKGFWILKRPSAPSTAAAPSLAGRLMQKLPSRSPRSPASLQRTSDGGI